VVAINGGGSHERERRLRSAAAITSRRGGRGGCPTSLRLAAVYIGSTTEIPSRSSIERRQSDERRRPRTTRTQPPGGRTSWPLPRRQLPWLPSLPSPLPSIPPTTTTLSAPEFFSLSWHSTRSLAKHIFTTRSAGRSPRIQEQRPSPPPLATATTVTCRSKGGGRGGRMWQRLRWSR
jgi:hypothetical protein